MPAEDVAGGVAPGGALIVLIAGQKIEKQARLVEHPALFTFTLTPQPEDVAEQLFGGLALQKNILLRRMFIGESRRHIDAFHPQPHDEIKKFRRFLCRFALKKGAVHGDAKAFADHQLDHVHSLIEDAGLTDGGVVSRPHAVQMNREGQVGRWRVVGQLLLQQQGVGAEVDIFAALNDALHDVGHLLVNQRFAAGDRDDRRAALINGVQTVGDAQSFVQNGVRIIDFTAA